MGLNDTPMGERLHIGFFGKRNAGKSSVVNSVTGQNLSLVSEVLGTTTDPVLKSMELHPLGPVVIIDTAGIDDEGALGKLRISKTKEIIRKTDVAVLVVDILKGLQKEDTSLIKEFKEKNIKYIIAYNKCDLISDDLELKENEILVSGKFGTNINELKEKIAEISRKTGTEKRIVGNRLKPGDFVVLVTPIDMSAPKGRLILPQQQTIRDILDSDAIPVVTKETQLENVLNNLSKKPKLVITDSQVFGAVSKIVPKDIPLTSFSILFANYKGDLETTYNGAKHLDLLKDGDTVLISEGCTHHRQCEDIGTVKMPKWIGEYTGKNLNYQFTSGGEFPKDIEKYSLIVHCGGCMLNEKEMKSRILCAKEKNIPITNYGIVISYMNGILERATEFIRNGVS